MASSVSLSPGEVARLRAALEREGPAPRPVASPHEALRVRDGSLSLVLYASGKLVFEPGARANALLSEVLDPGSGAMTAGSDETGKGEWYGPLVVAAVALSPEASLSARLAGIRDSKTVRTPESLGSLAREVLRLAAASHVVVIGVAEYNRRYERLSASGRSLNDLLAQAHAEALRAVIGAAPAVGRVVVDRFDEDKTARALAWLGPSIELEQRERGESEPAVAAASVLAKDAFDREVAALEREHGVALRGSSPSLVPAGALPLVAKHHFSNVHACLAPAARTGAGGQASLARWSA